VNHEPVIAVLRWIDTVALADAIRPSDWSYDRHWLVISITLFCLLAALIIGVQVNRARWRRAQAEATLIAEISSKFVNLAPGEVDREIMDAERRICELLGLGVAGLWQWTDEEPRSLRLTHLYGEVPVQPPDPILAAEHFPRYQRELAAGRVVCITSRDDLPPEAGLDRETMRLFGIRSNLTLPLTVGGAPRGGGRGGRAGLLRGRFHGENLLRRYTLPRVV
jgi:hypothetical protein